MNLFEHLSGLDKKKEREFKKTVREMDKGSARAKEKIRSMERDSDAAVASKVASARVDLYSQAACEGDRHAQYLMGVSLAQLNEKEVSLEWLTKLAQKGDVRAMKAIAQGYTADGPFGDHIQERRHWNRKAAEAGDAQAQARLGAEFIGKDEAKAREWLVKSAAQDCSEGLLGLGQSCFLEAVSCTGKEKAKRREKLLDRAEKCFLKAADTAAAKQDFAAACHELGNFYGSAAFGSMIPEKAAYFYYQAGANGDYPEDLEKFGQLRDSYGLIVNLSDIGRWEEQVFGTES